MQSNSETNSEHFSCQDQRYCGTLEEYDGQDQEDNCNIDLTLHVNELL